MTSTKPKPASKKVQRRDKDRLRKDNLREQARDLGLSLLPIWGTKIQHQEIKRILASHGFVDVWLLNNTRVSRIRANRETGDQKGRASARDIEATLMTSSAEMPKSQTNPFTGSVQAVSVAPYRPKPGKLPLGQSPASEVESAPTRSQDVLAVRRKKFVSASCDQYQTEFPAVMLSGGPADMSAGTGS